MKKRKHRLVVEITLNEPVTEHEACWALKEYLGRIDLDAKPAHQFRDVHLYADKLTVKQFSRVAASL